MQNNINNLVSIVEKNGLVLTHRDTTEEGVREYSCSTLIKKKNVLIKGETTSKNEIKKNPMIVLFDLKSGDIIGVYRVHSWKLIKRKRNYFIQ